MTAHDTVLALAAGRREPGEHEVTTTADDLSGRNLGGFIHVEHRGVEYVGHIRSLYHHQPLDGSTARVVIALVGQEDLTLDVPADAEVTVPEQIR